MPYCPKCEYEYQAGIEQCPDCGGELVEHVTQPPQQRRHLSTSAVIGLAVAIASAYWAAFAVLGAGGPRYQGNMLGLLALVALLAIGGVYGYCSRTDTHAAGWAQAWAISGILHVAVVATIVLTGHATNPYKCLLAAPFHWVLSGLAIPGALLGARLHEAMRSGTDS